ncbi:unnamed protein product [Cladocopium goreaui]|uniref:CBM20 domain-containing protein n=1 Tax=Cladocopium goreaui TaxID=2562237 RepID=A0A9P1G9M8_9DINO|nr:unnamed protein product [Cladocopium goreaui]
MTSIASNFFGKMSWGPRSRLRAASSGISAPSAGPAGPGGPSGGPFVTFRVTAKGMQADETLYMVGDHDDLGAGNPLLGKRLSCKDGKTWTIRRPLKRGMSTYRFVSVSKGTENGDSYVRWENHDNRVFKRHGPLTTCVEVLEITGFGERQRVTPPVIQPCKQEMEESLGPEPEPCQETETASASECSGVQDSRCLDDFATKFDLMTCEPECLRGQEEKIESVNNLRLSIVGLDSKPPQAVSADVNLPAQQWLGDCISSERQHVLEDQSCGLCQKAEVAEALLSTGAGKFETLETAEPNAALPAKLAERMAKLETATELQANLLERITKLETDAALPEKLLKRIAKLETDAELQAELVSELQAKARHVDSKIDSTKENLSQMAGSQYLKDCRMSRKQQELESIATCVQNKLNHITTLISDFEARFEKVDSAIASHQDHLATLSSDSDKWFKEVKSVMASDKNELTTLISHFDKRLKEVESDMESHKSDLATITSGTCKGFDKVEHVIASHKNELVTRLEEVDEKVERVIASQKNELATRLEEVENVMESHKNGLATLTSESHTGFEKVERVIASQKNELATRLEEVENVMESHKLSLATLTSDSHTGFEKVERVIASQKNELATRLEEVENVMESHKNGLATLTSESHTGFQKVERVIASQKNELATRLEEVENVMESHKNGLATLTSESHTGFQKVERVIASKKNELATRLEEVENVMESHKNGLATLTSESHTGFQKVERVIASHKNELATRLEEVESVAASQKSELASQKKSLLGLQRQINDLDLKIPEPDDFPPSLDSAAHKEIQQTQQQLKDLESQVSALSKSVQKMSENSTSAAKLKLPSALDAPTLHPTEVELQPDRAPPTVVQNEDLDEWNDVGLQRGDLEAKGMNVEQPQSNTRACSKPDDLKATGKSAFCGFQVPPKPEDEAIAKVCLEVEEKLHAAVRQNDPLDARKSLLRKVLLRLHSDKTGAPSAGMIWIEAWKNTHIEWYYNPHPVPEDQQKYMRK